MKLIKSSLFFVLITMSVVAMEQQQEVPEALTATVPDGDDKAKRLAEAVEKLAVGGDTNQAPVTERQSSGSGWGLGWLNPVNWGKSFYSFLVAEAEKEVVTTSGRDEHVSSIFRPEVESEVASQNPDLCIERDVKPYRMTMKLVDGRIISFNKKATFQTLVGVRFIKTSTKGERNKIEDAVWTSLSTLLNDAKAQIIVKVKEGKVNKNKVANYTQSVALIEEITINGASFNEWLFAQGYAQALKAVAAEDAE